MKSILMLVSPETGLDARLEAAIALARTSGAHLTALQVVDMSIYEVYPSLAGPIYTSGSNLELEKFAADRKAHVEQRLSREDIAWDFINLTIDEVGNALSFGSLSDLIVCGQPGPFFPAFDSIMMASHTPIMVIPNNLKSFDPTGQALVAWNGSLEAANALRASVPLLKFSSGVDLLTVGKLGHDDFPPTGALKYLSRHGIEAELKEDLETGGRIADRLHVHAKAQKTAWMVLGAYSHARMLEVVFGGVTRTILKQMELPVLLAR